MHKEQIKNNENNSGAHPQRNAGFSPSRASKVLPEKAATGRLF
jgi:hypothetical protein